MLASNLIFELRQSGYVIQADGGYVCVSPIDNLSTELVEQLKHNKREILIELQREAEEQKSFQECNEVALAVEHLHGFTLAELEKLAANDWGWLKQDTKALKTFAHACATLGQLKKGTVPKHYTAVVYCKNCGEVPIFNSVANGKHVLGCVWCATEYPLTKH